MKHFEAIKIIGYKISELKDEVQKLDQMSDEKKNYSGYVFYKEDVRNMNSQLKSLQKSIENLLS